MIRPYGTLGLLVLLLSTTSRATADGPAPSDSAKADADFRVQGEYIGEISTRDGGGRFGVQIVAAYRGEHEFDAYAYSGGLPGAGWLPGSAKRLGPVAGSEQGGVTTFDSLLGGVGRIEGANGILHIVITGKEIGRLERVERRSPTLGAKPPEGAIVLFDGTGTAGFRDGRRTEEGFLRCGTSSRLEHQSVFLHLEFRTPYQPRNRGQGRGNSGVYLQSRYEVQILDSFGLEGRSDEAGGIYSVKPPDVNMCLPPLSWQTYDVEFRSAAFDPDGRKVADARMTVWHNGVLVQKDVAVPKSTTASPQGESPKPGPLYLQDHSNPVVFRNIWIVNR